MSKEKQIKALLEKNFPGASPEIIGDTLKDIMAINADWIKTEDEEPPLYCVACDDLENLPFIPRGILRAETESGRKLYIAEDSKGDQRYIAAWLPLPKPYGVKVETWGE